MIFILLLLHSFLTLSAAQSTLCRTACGAIPIHYPLTIDNGCGSPDYHNKLICSNSSTLHFRTPSGTYPVLSIDYLDPHLVIFDISMWSCTNPNPTNPTAPPFSLDTSTHFTLSTKNNYLFFNCSDNAVIIEPKPSFCDRFPDRCDSACDSAGYLCRNLPVCPNVLSESGTSCCSYYPKATESLRLMTRYCAAYTSVYWRSSGVSFAPYDQVPEYGVRVDFDIPVTTRCLKCEDNRRGGGTCGFDPATREFVCLCEHGNATAFCTDGTATRHKTSAGVIAGTSIASVASVAGVGALLWYIRKLRSNRPVTCGVQSNENRLF